MTSESLLKGPLPNFAKKASGPGRGITTEGRIALCPPAPQWLPYFTRSVVISLQSGHSMLIFQHSVPFKSRNFDGEHLPQLPLQFPHGFSSRLHSFPSGYLHIKSQMPRGGEISSAEPFGGLQSPFERFYPNKKL